MKNPPGTPATELHASFFGVGRGYPNAVTPEASREVLGTGDALPAGNREVDLYISSLSKGGHPSGYLISRGLGLGSEAGAARKSSSPTVAQSPKHVSGLRRCSDGRSPERTETNMYALTRKAEAIRRCDRLEARTKDPVVLREIQAIRRDLAAQAPGGPTYASAYAHELDRLMGLSTAGGSRVEGNRLLLSALRGTP